MKNVLLVLRQIRPSLSSTEQQIARFILKNPEETTRMTIRQLAQSTFSSPSSVVRVCRAAGFDGYKDLRSALLIELATLGGKGSHREEEVTRDDTPQQIIEKVTQKNIQCLMDTQRLLSAEVLAECARLVNRSRMVMLFGVGASLCVARDTYLKFLRLNKPCVVNDDWHSQLLQARNATAEDVGLVFSYSGQTVEMIRCMEAMRENKTPIIAVTRYYPSQVARLADHVLYIAANESLFRNGAMSSRLSQLNVVDILYTVCANADYDETILRLTRTHISKPGEPEGRCP